MDEQQQQQQQQRQQLPSVASSGPGAAVSMPSVQPGLDGGAPVRLDGGGAGETEAVELEDVNLQRDEEKERRKTGHTERAAEHPRLELRPHIHENSRSPVLKAEGRATIGDAEDVVGDELPERDTSPSPRDNSDSEEAATSEDGSHAHSGRADQARVQNGHSQPMAGNPATLYQSEGLAVHRRWYIWLGNHLNFYRLHLLWFTLFPLFLSGIFYASDDGSHSYIDCLFLCYSAICVCGLSPVLIEGLSNWQQAILLIQMAIGSAATVSIVTIVVRREFFKRRFRKMIETDARARKRARDVEAADRDNKRFHRVLHPFAFGPSEKALEGAPPHSRGSSSPGDDTLLPTSQMQKKSKMDRLRPDMIKRVDSPVRVNQMSIGGNLDQGTNIPVRSSLEPDMPHDPAQESAAGVRLELAVDGEESDGSLSDLKRTSDGIEDQGARHGRGHARRSSDPSLPTAPGKGKDKIFKRVRTLDPPKSTDASSPIASPLPRTQTIEIREPPHPVHYRREQGTSSAVPGYGGGDTLRRRATTASLERTASRRTAGEGFTSTLTGDTAMVQGFGGFPNPVMVVANAAQRFIPKSTTNEMNRTTTLQSVHSLGGLSAAPGARTKEVSYISFDAIVGRNSRFYSLTEAQREELGGVEYRALTLLLKITVAYYTLVQGIALVVLCPLFASSIYRSHFEDVGSVTGKGAWYVAFNIVSAYSNTGMSLLDTSMSDFQQSYGYVLWIGLLILAGNTAFPVFLRLIIWLMSKIAREGTRTKETLQFVLDHPRRCFIFLFPTAQTLILAFAVFTLTSIDWVAFNVLDIGNQVVDSLIPAARAIDSLFQAIAVRNAGFSIVALSGLSPAVQFLFVIMMYISVYPLALSIRSTNVYEEKALGVWEDDDTSSVGDEYQRNRKPGSFVAHHVRRQLAFDLWWLALAVFVICIVEKSKIQDPNTNNYFNVFTVLFEVVSAYGCVGLSLGVPFANFSLCGDFRTLSKLVLIAVILRGRHRGLPVAIDRSILLPSDIEAINAAKPRHHQLSQGRIEEDQENADAASAYFRRSGEGSNDEASRRRISTSNAEAPAVAADGEKLSGAAAGSTSIQFVSPTARSGDSAVQ